MRFINWLDNSSVPCAQISPGRFDEAEAQWKRLLSQNSGFLQAQRGLRELDRRRSLAASCSGPARQTTAVPCFQETT
jgi:hypothetical protein